MYIWVNDKAKMRQGNETTYGITIIIRDEWASFRSYTSRTRRSSGVHPQALQRDLVDSQELGEVINQHRHHKDSGD